MSSIDDSVKMDVRMVEAGEEGQELPQRVLDPTYLADKDLCLSRFDGWTKEEQSDFIENLLRRISEDQQAQVGEFVTPLLQRDFVTLFPKKGLDHIAENILSYLDVKSLCVAKLVCKDWNGVISNAMLWKKLIERHVRTDLLWRGLGERRRWIDYLFKLRPGTIQPENSFYQDLYSRIIQDVKNIKNKWLTGDPDVYYIHSPPGNHRGIYHVQYDDSKIVTGQRDNSIKIWNKQTLECTHVLTGHTGSVLCLQFDEKVIISASSDATARVWDLKTGQLLNILRYHYESVLHLRFKDGLIVTGSKDRHIAVWIMHSPTDIILHRVLVGHRAAVNVVEFDEKYIVSASGDKTIKVWDTNSCAFIRTLIGHRRGIACLDYRDGRVVSGSSDNTVRLWDVESGTCLRILVGHEDLVRCIRFDSKRIVSGSYDGKIIVWDLQAALDPMKPAPLLLLRTLNKHTGRVLRLQFDDFQIVSSSQDDTMLVWDFLPPAEALYCNSYF